jgi:hypothetical protein
MLVAVLLPLIMRPDDVYVVIIAASASQIMI